MPCKVHFFSTNLLCRTNDPRVRPWASAANARLDSAWLDRGPLRNRARVISRKWDPIADLDPLNPIVSLLMIPSNHCPQNVTFPGFL